jgi:uncharacterized paraquat-inducible protein A
MSKLGQTLVAGIVGLAALTYAGPTLVALVHALVPLVLVIGMFALVWQLVRYFTRR